MQLRPSQYRSFYDSFFGYKAETLEHFGFMEFLNLEHSAAIDSENRQMKEIFDNAANVSLEEKSFFKTAKDDKVNASLDQGD